MLQLTSTVGRGPKVPGPGSSQRGVGAPARGRATMTMRKGVPISPGVAVAHAHCIDPVRLRGEPHRLDAEALSGEASRFDRACDAATRELDAVVSRVSQQVGEEEAAIFRAHRLLLRDPTLAQKVKAAIFQRHVDA